MPGIGGGKKGRSLRNEDLREAIGEVWGKKDTKRKKGFRKRNG